MFKDASDFFSRGTPHLAEVIPVMDAIEKRLRHYQKRGDFLPSIQAAVGLSMKTLKKYYSQTTHSDLYQIAMGMYFMLLGELQNCTHSYMVVLHPSYKLQYFEESGWTCEQIKTAKDLTTDEYNTSYANRGVETPSTQVSVNSDVADKKKKVSHPPSYYLLVLIPISM